MLRRVVVRPPWRNVLGHPRATCRSVTSAGALRRNRSGTFLGLCVAAGLALSTRAALADQTLDMHATATQSTGAFKKFVFSWPVSDHTVVIGFTGSISTHADAPSFSEALVQVWSIPKGDCPQPGEEYDSYAKIGVRYPAHTQLLSHIIKTSGRGTTTLPVDLTLPTGVLIDHCVVALLDGSTLAGGRYTMTSDLVMHYRTPTMTPTPAGTTAVDASTVRRPATTQAADAASRWLLPSGFGDEVCFGTASGCGTWHTVNNALSFASFSTPVTVDTELVAVHGNTASSPLSPDLSARLHFTTPEGAWSVTNDLYAIARCVGLPRGRVGPGSFYDMPPFASGEKPAPSAGSKPTEARNILSFTMHSSGMEPTEASIHHDFPDVLIRKGGCIAHLVRRTGGGGINSEYQLTLFTRAALQPALPKPPVGAPHASPSVSGRVQN